MSPSFLGEWIECGHSSMLFFSTVTLISKCKSNVSNVLVVRLIEKETQNVFFKGDENSDECKLNNFMMNTEMKYLQ